MKTYWTTFYSYKGGVGRSLAMANVAALLVKHGHRVVLLDFDLEAPGLDTFVEFAEAKGKPGIIEYVADFQRQIAAPDITAFVHPIALAEELRGRLWIMPAGRKDKAYTHLLGRTKWSELYETGMGAPFVENWKLSIEQTFQPDYALIDSRTGLTEVGGVCTTAFPDLVVMLFGLNEQNVEGTATVARHIREADLQRPPQLHFVATPIPNLPPDKNGLLRQRLESAEKALGCSLGADTIRYWPTAALTERLFVLDDWSPPPAIVTDHHRVYDRITKFNRNGLDFLGEQGEQAITSDDLELAEKLEVVLTEHFPNRAEALFLRSRLARLAGHGEQAVQLAEESFALDPAYVPSFDFLSTHFRRAGQLNRVEELCERVLSLGSRISQARKLDVLETLAQLCMTARKYNLAARHYSAILDLTAKVDEADGPGLAQLARLFNAAESLRRAGDHVDFTRWKPIITLFEGIPALGGNPEMTANRCQAMHIAYALTGNLEAARDCLRKARQVAETVNELEQIFSVRDYRNVSRGEFWAINDEMTAALDRGELWDGTKLVSGPLASQSGKRSC